MDEENIYRLYCSVMDEELALVKTAVSVDDFQALIKEYYHTPIAEDGSNSNLEDFYAFLEKEMCLVFIKQKEPRILIVPNAHLLL